MKKFLAAIAIAALSAVPFTGFAHGDEADVTVPLGDAPEAGQGNVYLDAESAGIWQESNGDAGLQTTAHTHGDSTIQADTRIV